MVLWLWGLSLEGALFFVRQEEGLESPLGLLFGQEEGLLWGLLTFGLQEVWLLGLSVCSVEGLFSDHLLGAEEGQVFGLREVEKDSLHLVGAEQGLFSNLLEVEERFSDLRSQTVG